MMQNGVLITAPNSGSGKTVITLGILRALARKMNVRSAKSGPDYIDPRFHEFACGNTSFNLDTWAMTSDRLKELSCGKGTYIVEGAMGLFDGDSSGLSGSTALLAKTLNLHVVLVIDCSKMAQSVAALVRGFITHDTELNFLGIILNKLGSEKHEKMIRNSLSDSFFPPVIGALKRDSAFHQPSRHLGLVQASERDDLEHWLDNMADEIEVNVDLDKLDFNNNLKLKSKKLNSPPGQNISIARDKAFSFIYPHLEQDWKKAGATIRYFSPLANEPVPNSDFIYLPGGYPELYAGIIANNSIFINSMQDASKKSLIYGECGGYMVLGKILIGNDGTKHKMLNLLDLVTTFESPKLTLGYRKLKSIKGSFVGSFFGHEFHYAKTEQFNGESLFTSSDSSDNSLPNLGLVNGLVSGSFAHIIDKTET